MELDGISVWQLLIILIILIIFCPSAVVAYLLGKEKGHNKWAWGFLGAVPLAGQIALIYYVGAPNRRLGEKLRALESLRITE